MEESGFDLHLGEVADAIRAEGADRVLVQLPEGLRWRGPEIVAAIAEASGAEALLSATPTFGACDLADDEAAKVGCDMLVHFGHTGFPNLGDYAVPVHFAGVDHSRRRPVEPLLEDALPMLTGPVGLLSTSQDIDLIETARDWLADRDVEARTAEGKGRIAVAGQVLGCNYTAGRRVEGAASYLFLGSGDFHPLGLAMALEKPTVVCDIERGEVRELADLTDRILRQRHAAIAASDDADRWGLIVSTKGGQHRPDQAKRLKERADDHGLDAEILVVDVVSPELLSQFRHLDAFVNLACPRIATDDYHRYDKPLLTPVEFEIAIGERDWEDWRFDELP